VSTACGSSGAAAAASSSSSDGDIGDDEVKDRPAAAAKAERLQIVAGGKSVVPKIFKGISDDDYESLKVGASPCCYDVCVLSCSVAKPRSTVDTASNTFTQCTTLHRYSNCCSL
jgi:hypothetical protein